MSTTNQISSNAFEIVYNSSDTPALLMAAIKEIFVGKGYTPLAASPITNIALQSRQQGSIPIGGLLSLGFTAPNADGFSSKPIVVEIASLNAGSVNLQLCTAETITANSNGYAYTNPPSQQFMANSAYTMMLTSISKSAFGRIILFVSSRYAVAQHKTDAGILSDWHGIFEMAREYSGNNQALGIPTHCYISTWLMKNAFEVNLSTTVSSGVSSISILSATYNGPVCLMRTRAGSTGATASAGTRLITANGEVGIQGLMFNGTANNYGIFGRRFQDIIPSAVNAWNNKNWASNIAVLSDTDQSSTSGTFANATLNAPSYVGKIYGLKAVTTNMGSTMDQLSMPVDANGFVDAAGTPTTQYVLSNPSNNARFALPQ